MTESNSLSHFSCQLPSQGQSIDSPTFSPDTTPHRRDGRKRMGWHTSSIAFDHTFANRYRNSFENSLDAKPSKGDASKLSNLLTFRFDKVSFVSLREFSTCIFAVVAFLATVITLHVYDRRPLRPSTLGISLNVLLSIYATTMKVAMTSVIATGLGKLTWSWFKIDRPLHDLVAFDQGSRGSFGLLYLLWHVGFHQILVSLGALLAVSLLAIEPFTQQIVQYVGCDIVVADQRFVIPASKSSVSYYPSELALYSGIWAYPQRLTAVCPTGTCPMTPEYSSVAYCSSCHNISHLIETNCHNLTGTASISGGPSINWTVGDSDVTYASLLKTRYSLQILMNTMTSSIDTADRMANPENMSACNDTCLDDKRYCKGLEAVECISYACVKTYTASVVEGEFTENQTDVFPANFTWGVYRGDNTTANRDNGDDEDIDSLVDNLVRRSNALVDIHCLDQAEQQALISLGYVIPTGQRWMWVDSASELSQFDFHRRCVYQLGSSPILNMFSDRFVGNLTLHFSNDTQTSAVTTQGPEFLQAIYGSKMPGFDVISGRLENISLSLTNFLRMNPDAYARKTVSGQVLQHHTCLNVRWKWVSFPALIVVLCVHFYFLVIISTITVNSSVRKSVPLAMAFHGPFSDPSLSEWKETHDCEQRSDGSSDSGQIKSFEVAAKQLLVRLDKRGEKFEISKDQTRRRSSNTSKVSAWLTSKIQKRAQNNPVSRRKKHKINSDVSTGENGQNS